MTKLSRWRLFRHPVVYTNVIFAALAGAIGGVTLALGFYITAATMAFLMVLSCFMPLWYKRGFQHGWLVGRHAMLNSMAEATRRRMSLEDWVEAELERDGVHFLKFEIDHDATE